jgi:hypothetical protein
VLFRSSTTNPPFTSAVDSILTSSTSITVLDTTGFPPSGTICVKNASQYEYMNYSGKTLTSFTGLTRAKAGASGVTVTMGAGQNIGTIADGLVSAALQPGMRAISSEIPDEAFLVSINPVTGQFVLSHPTITANPTISFPAMGASNALQFTYDQVSPIGIELAFPTFAPSISHWGTSVIMDGRYDEEKSLVFTYGQRTATSVPAGATRALMSIRSAPSADNGIAAAFGAREVVNRMQLALKALDVTATTSTGTPTVLVTATLNGLPSTATTWTNAVGNVTTLVNSSLAQIADYSGGTTTISGGEVTGGFFSQGTNSVDLSQLRDLGNSILGGGGTVTNAGIYPDGPDVLTISVTNLGSQTASVFSRLSWTEASA